MQSISRNVDINAQLTRVLTIASNLSAKEPMRSTLQVQPAQAESQFTPTQANPFPTFLNLQVGEFHPNQGQQHTEWPLQQGGDQMELDGGQPNGAPQLGWYDDNDYFGNGGGVV